MIPIRIKYRKGYKNQLHETVSFQLPQELWTDEEIRTEFFRIDVLGWATIYAGYAWDGASGPTADIPASQIIVPSLIHDMLCQLDRAGMLRSVPGARKHADRLLMDMLRERGMNKLRSWIWYRGVRFGSTMDGGPKEILEQK